MRHFGARITDRFHLGDLRTVIIENEFLRTTVLVDQGCDFIELLYKPRDTDFLWRSPNGVRRRPRAVSPPRGVPDFHEYYAGGWQELFPQAGAASVYAGAELPFHGEVWALPWEYEITRDEPDIVEARFSVQTIRMPFYLERWVSLRSGEPVVRLRERVTNRGQTELEFMWGHHPAFGPPFLEPGCRLDAPAGKVQIGDTFLPWPVDSHGFDHSQLTPQESDREVMKFLHELREGWVALSNPLKKIGVGLAFDPEVFSYVWLWHEFGYTREYPWFGRAYVIGVEPQSSLPKARDTGGRLLRLAPGAKLETDFLAVAYEASGVDHISRDGHVTPKPA